MWNGRRHWKHAKGDCSCCFQLPGRFASTAWRAKTARELPASSLQPLLFSLPALFPSRKRTCNLRKDIQVEQKSIVHSAITAPHHFPLLLKATPGNTRISRTSSNSHTADVDCSSMENWHTRQSLQSTCIQVLTSVHLPFITTSLQTTQARAGKRQELNVLLRVSPVATSAKYL